MPTDPVATPPPPTDLQQIRQVFDRQRETALRWRQSTAAERISRIRSLCNTMMAHRDALHEAFAADLGKPPAEIEATEFLPVLEEVRIASGKLRGWMKPRRPRPTLTMLGTFARVQYQPRGRTLIIAPWNYPLSLCFGPLVSALAAGNPVILKPSEWTPAVSGRMAQIIDEAFPDSEVALFEGTAETAMALLDLPFEHIFFTGSPAVGSAVMASAATHLASVTLELGGKSPAVVCESADLRLAAETLMWGKFLNDGQTCIAPDHVWVHASVKEAFIEECRVILLARYGSDTRRPAPDLARIVNRRHTERIAHLLADALERGARLRLGGTVDLDRHFIAPTLLDQIPRDAAILNEEIFGPVLPILEYTQTDAVIDAINARPKPLALYVWSRDRRETAAIVARTSSGGACINHCVVQFAHSNLPFGGVNGSGLGSAHGFHGFKTFSHERAILRSSPIMLSRMFHPPYTKSRLRLVRVVVDLLHRLGR